MILQHWFLMVTVYRATLYLYWFSKEAPRLIIYYHYSYLESREAPKKTHEKRGGGGTREIRVISAGNCLPVMPGYGDVIPGDGTSGDLYPTKCRTVIIFLVKQNTY